MTDASPGAVPSTTTSSEGRDSRPSLSCVILTAGGRDEALRRAVGSVLAQHGAPIEVIVIGNGAPVPELPTGVRTLDLPENLGIPGGRNVGVEHTHGDVVLFLDDDGFLPDRSSAERLRGMFFDDPSLGIVTLRIVDPETKTTQRRHVPRIRVGNPRESSDVTTFLGGASAVRRSVFATAGPLPAVFFYGHEESDLAWRALDAGWRIRYEADLVMHHPATLPGRHSAYLRMNARNRVWLVRRRLPVPLAVVHLAVWVVLTLVRLRNPGTLLPWLRGLVEGLRTPCGERRPISWRTAMLMTRLGRPPIV
jgi:GT2 family glycosyltransferase